MMYALGRELEYYDMPQMRAVVRSRRGAGLSVVGDRVRHRASDAFRMQAVVKGDGAGVQASATKDSARVQE